MHEEQDLVYLDHRPTERPASEEPRAPDDGPDPAEGGAPSTWAESFVADEVVLFRFSALTFNSHRIHYDQPYATGVEGYPGLVVHGPRG